MERSELLAQFPVGSPHAAELVDVLLADGWSVGEIDHSLRVGTAAHVDGLLRGTSVREAFARARQLDDQVRREWVAAWEASAERRRARQVSARRRLALEGTPASPYLIASAS